MNAQTGFKTESTLGSAELTERALQRRTVEAVIWACRRSTTILCIRR